MEKAQAKDQKAFEKAFDKEHNKRFGNRKPSEHELEELYEEITDRRVNSKTSEDAYWAWSDYIKQSREITNGLIGKYGDTKLKNINVANYSAMINRILDDIGNEKEYKKVFSEWNNAEAKWYWNLDKSKSDKLNKRQEELGKKEAAYEEKLKSKGYSDEEINKMRKDALAEDPSYHKYEEEYDRKKRYKNIKD